MEWPKSSRIAWVLGHPDYRDIIEVYNERFRLLPSIFNSIQFNPIQVLFHIFKKGKYKLHGLQLRKIDYIHNTHSEQ